MGEVLPGAEEAVIDVNEGKRLRLPGLHTLQPNQDILLEY